MALTYGEWLRDNPAGNGMQYHEYKSRLAQVQKAREAVEETTGAWAQVLGHYDTEFVIGGQPRLMCLKCGYPVEYVNDGDTLLTLAIKAIEHEKENHPHE